MPGRMMYGAFVLAVVLLAGCTVTVTNQGELVVIVDNVPGNVTKLTYTAESRAGLGHFRKGNRTVHGSQAVLDFGQVAQGRWRIAVQGWDPRGRRVFERTQTFFVRSGERNFVYLGGSGPPPRR